MKTVTGEIVSSTPVPISKAASILSKFVSAETGASQAVGAYLRRATAALDELVRLHSEPYHKKHKKHKKHKSDVSTTTTTTVGPAATIEEIPTQSMEVSHQGPNHGVVTGRKKEKKKGKGDFENIVTHESRIAVKEEQGEGNVAEDTGKKKKKKSANYGDDKGRGGVEINEEKTRSEGNLEEETERKKHEKKKRGRDNVGNSEENGVEIKEENNGFGSLEENGGNIELVKENKEERKKRKNRDAEESKNNEVEEHRSKKMKRRRKGEEEDN